MKEKKPLLKNVFELKTPFPKRIFFQEIAFVDDTVKTVPNLMRKFNIRYFKFDSAMHHPDHPNARIIIGTITHFEREKWYKVLEEMDRIGSDMTDYIFARNCLHEALDKFVIK